MFEIETVMVECETGKKVFTYKLKAEGEDITVTADRSLTLDELKDKIDEYIF